MKKLFISVMIFIIALALASCGDVATQAPGSSGSSPNGSAAGTDLPKIDIGFSLAGEDAFDRQLAADIESECASLGYIAKISVAATADQQQEDIQYMLAAGASVIVIDPVDVDSLEMVIAECATNNADVINMIEPINGYVSTLISPNFKAIGESAGECASEILADSGGDCMILKTEYGSLNMQLMSDGFEAGIDGEDDITVVSDPFCGSDEELAYSTVKTELASNDIDFIFAQNSALAKGAVKAADESGKNVKIVAFGGDMDIINAVSQSKVYASIFFGPGALAREVVSNADNFIKSDSYVPPQYIELTIVTVKQADASGYYKEGEDHAEINQ